MKKVIIFTVMVCLALTLAAKVNLSVILEKVAKEPNLKAAVKVGEDGTYSDALISITWEARPDVFLFELTNKTDGKLVIPWAECRFIDEENKSFMVVHGEAGEFLTIEGKGTVVSAVAPADYFSWNGKAWEIGPIFLNRMSDEEFETVKDKDLIYKVVLPVRKDKGLKTAYHFIFNTMAE
jgi:hypothetical protein